MTAVRSMASTKRDSAAAAMGEKVIEDLQIGFGFLIPADETLACEVVAVSDFDGRSFITDLYDLMHCDMVQAVTLENGTLWCDENAQHRRSNRILNRRAMEMFGHEVYGGTLVGNVVITR